MNITNYQRAIAVCVKAGVVPMGWGPGGVGKTQSNRQVASAANIEYRALVGNLLTLDALTGIPYNTQVKLRDPETGDVSEGNGMVWSRPVGIPDRGKGLLLLDEITDAMQSIQKQLYSLILDREVNGHRLGNGWAVSAAGNRPADGSGSSMLPAPLITRMVHLGVCCEVPDFTRQLPESADVDHKEWARWAIGQGVVPEIVAFIGRFPEHLYNRQATPRTWEMLSGILKVLKSSDPIAADLVNGCVGAGVGITFFGFLRLAAQIPDPAEILRDPAGAPIPADLSVVHALLSTLVYISDRAAVPALVQYAGRLSAELGAYLLLGVADKDPEFKTVPEYIGWYNANQDTLA